MTSLVQDFSLEHCLKGERLEHVTIAIVELVLKLHPVQPEGMEEGRQALHHQQDTDGQDYKRGQETSNKVAKY